MRLTDLTPLQAEAEKHEGRGWVLHAREKAHVLFGAVKLLAELLEAELG